MKKAGPKNGVVKTIQEHIDESMNIHILQELGERDNLRTPDYLDLKEEINHYLFVYGTLKSDGRLSAYLDDCPFLGAATTALGNFQMEISKAGKFPIIMETKHPRDGNQVWGEVYVVTPMTILELDEVEGNGEMYVRRQRWCWLEDQKALLEKPGVKPAERCWVYEGNPTYWQGRETFSVMPRKVGATKGLIFANPKPESVLRVATNPVTSLLDSWQHKNNSTYWSDELPF